MTKQTLDRISIGPLENEENLEKDFHISGCIRLKKFYTKNKPNKVLI
jgi:hypothetical protein